MVEPHTHNGGDSPRVRAEDLKGFSVITADYAVSARTVQPSVIERGTYTLAGGVKLVTFPYVYSTATGLVVLLTSNTTNPAFLQGIVTSAFTVSGSGTDTGYWLAMGYK